MDTPEISPGLLAEMLAQALTATITKGKGIGTALVGKEMIPKISIPVSMSYKVASQHLEKKHAEENRTVQVDRTFPVLPWAGAFAVQTVVEKIDVCRGSYYEVLTPMGPVKRESEEIQVPCSRGAGTKGSRPVFWGHWEIADLGDLKMWHRQKPNSKVSVFGISISCLQKNRGRAESLIEEIDKEVAKCELYQGTCISLQPDDDGDLIISSPPEVFPVPDTMPDDLILSSTLEKQVHSELFTPIKDREKLKRLGVKGSRGILLAGRPGTGKTMSARIATRLALNEGWSAFYLPDARAIEAALAIASAHAPAILICEDLDRQLGGKRNAATDRVLNALDGLDKSKEVIFIATTNDDTGLPAALLRPGRLHSLIDFECPDAEAAGRLLRLFLKDKAPSQLKEAAEACARLLPASIEEVAKRSILHAVNDGRLTPNEQDLRDAASGVHAHQRRLEIAEAKDHPVRPAVDVHLHEEGESNGNGKVTKANMAGAALIAIQPPSVTEKVS